VRLQAAEQGQQQNSVIAASEKLSSRNNGLLPTEETKQLQAELIRVKKENARLQSELLTERRNAKVAADQQSDLLQQIEILQSELAVLRSSSNNTEPAISEQMQQDREEAMETLEHVASVWEQADSAVQRILTILQELAPDESHDRTEAHDRGVSTIETAALVHGQIKVALMLIELKLRNNLACLHNDKLYIGIKADDEALLERLDTIQDDAMSAIEQVQTLLNEQLDQLQEQPDDEDENGRYTQEEMEQNMSQMRRMTNRRAVLDERMSELLDEDYSQFAREEVGEDGSVEQFVSTKIMEKLQDEVLQILGSLQDKNGEIGRLKTTVEELTVRERSLMNELRRIMGEQAKIEAAERQRRMEAMRAMDPDDDEDSTRGENSGSGFASSVDDFSDDDDGGEYDEITYYEEVTIAE
jgi:hypothetical protein